MQEHPIGDNLLCATKESLDVICVVGKDLIRKTK